MGILDQTGFVERLTFFNGQRLFASDLQGVEAFNREMRWLHNQSLHQPGVGRGLAVTGKRDDREVRVGPGYALDATGREIVLTREQVEPVPPVAAEDDGQSVFFDLAVSYPDDGQLVEAETRDGICLPRGVVRLREEPILCWIRLQRSAVGLVPADPKLRGEVQGGLRIVLARIEVLQCRLRQDVSVAERLSARPARQPYIACGHQPAGLQQLQIGDGQQFRLTAEVDTSSAGFLTAPCYSVRLDGERVQTGLGERVVSFVIDSPPTVLAPTNTGFRLEVLASLVGQTPEGTTGKPWDDWTAVWMGVE